MNTKNNCVDVRHLRVSNKRGFWPRDNSAPDVPLLDWIYPTEAVMASAAAVRKQAEIVGITDFADYAIFANTTFRSVAQPETDELAADFWQFPTETLYRMAGDCEDLAFLVASALITDEIGKEKTSVVLGSIAVDGKLFPHAWVQVALDDGNYMILDHDLDLDEPIDVHYEASLIFNWERAENLSKDPVEKILSKSFAWGWRPPRIRPPRIRIPDIRIPGVPNPIEAAKRDLQNKATQLAASYKSSNPNADQDDCVAIVAAGLAAYGAAKGSSGGPWGAAFGAAIGAGGGVPLARIACRRAFP
jgi:hypothetical protein